MFRLDAVGNPDAELCTGIGHDEDGDLLDDACDPCPFDSASSPDGDDDGIADSCDPEPTVPSQLLLFDGFGSASASTLVGGSIVDDAYTTGISTVDSALWALPAGLDVVWVVAGVSVNEIAVDNYRELGVIFDASLGSTQVDGTHCVLARYTSDYTQLFVRNRPAGDVPFATRGAALTLPQLRDGTLRARHGRDDTLLGTTCDFSAPAGKSNIAGVRMPTPPEGSVALFSNRVDARFEFIHVVGRQ